MWASSLSQRIGGSVTDSDADADADAEADSATNLLSGQRTTAAGQLVANCNMVSLTPFTKEPRSSSTTASSSAIPTIRRVRRGYEAAMAKLLAIEHLNHGDGSVIDEIANIDKTCPIRFGLDLVDTQLGIGGAAMGLARRLANVDVPPCVFLGSQLGVVTASTSRVIASHGSYPQLSGSSTGSFLDDRNLFPLLSRTIPSTKGHARAALSYLLEQRGVRSLGLLYVDDPYGYHYFRDLEEAVAERGVDNNVGDHDSFRLEALPVLPDLSNLADAMEFVKANEFGTVLVAVYGEYLTDHSLMTEALRKGVAGSDSDTAWIFADDLLTDPSDWVFDLDLDSPLIDAYEGTSILTASGRGSSLQTTTTGSKYREFTRQLWGLRDRGISHSSSSSSDSDNSSDNYDNNTTLRAYWETMITDEDIKPLAIEFLDELLEDEEFLHPEFLHSSVPYEYESVVMAGLAVCNSLKNNNPPPDRDSSTEHKNHDRNASLPLFLDGEEFQRELVRTTIRGISGDVRLDPKTGTRLSNSTYYALQTMVAENFVERSSDGEGVELAPKARFRKRNTAMLEPQSRIPGDNATHLNHHHQQHQHQHLNHNSSEHIYDERGWTYVYQDTGTTLIPNIMPRSISPRHAPPAFAAIDTTGVHERDVVRIFQGVFCGVPILVALGFFFWTYFHRNQPIVRASKPLFLYLICTGVILFAFATLPLAVMGTSGVFENGDFNGIVPKEFVSIMTVVCSASIWIRTLGFAVIASALFSKTYRINKIIHGTKLYRTTRARVLADFLVPLTVMVAMNSLVLCLMTVLDPVTYGIVTTEASSIDGYETCLYTSDQRHRFWIPLVGWNIFVLALALYQSWSVRMFDLEPSTRVPSEGQQIFNALLSSLLISLIGMPIMLVVRDKGDPAIIDLVEAALVFVFCASVLFCVFAIKVQHICRTKPNQQDTTDTDESLRNNNNNNDGSPQQIVGSSSTHSKTKKELKVENEGLRKRNLELEEELVLYPTSGSRNNNMLKDFFGKLLGSEDDSYNETTKAPSIEGSIELTADAPTLTTPKASSERCKKMIQDIFFDPSDLIPTLPPAGLRISARVTGRPRSSATTTGKGSSFLYQSTSTGSDNYIYKSSSSSDYKRNYKAKLKNSSHSNRMGSSPTNLSSDPKTSSPSQEQPESDESKTKKGDSPESNALSHLRPHRSSYYRRGPEPEDYSTAPPEKRKSSLFNDSMVPQPPRRRDSPKSYEASLKSANDNSGDVKPRWMFPISFSSMEPLGSPSTASPASQRPKRGSPKMGIPKVITIYTNHWREPAPQWSDPLFQRTPRRPSTGVDIGMQRDPPMAYRHTV